MTRREAEEHKPLCIPFEDWPDVDRAAWSMAITKGSRLSPLGPLARLRQISLLGLKKSYGRWLGWLSAVAQVDLTHGSTRHITPSLVRRYTVDLLKTNAPLTIYARLRHLGRIAKAIAPHAEWRFLDDAAKRFRRTVRPQRDPRPRLRASWELVELGIKLMKIADQNPEWSRFRRAARYRNGLMIAMLAARPIRLRNFAMIELDQHLRKHGDSWSLSFFPRETKTSRHLEFALPTRLCPFLEHYLAVHRPVLLNRVTRRSRGPTKALWVSILAAAATEKGIYQLISSATAQEFGKPINPHLFRACAATSLAMQSPKQVRIASAILGHSSFGTTEEYYILANGLEASARYVETIGELRD